MAHPRVAALLVALPYVAASSPLSPPATPQKQCFQWCHNKPSEGIPWERLCRWESCGACIECSVPRDPPWCLLHTPERCAADPEVRQVCWVLCTVPPSPPSLPPSPPPWPPSFPFIDLVDDEGEALFTVIHDKAFTLDVNGTEFARYLPRRRLDALSPVREVRRLAGAAPVEIGDVLIFKPWHEYPDRQARSCDGAADLSSNFGGVVDQNLEVSLRLVIPPYYYHGCFARGPVSAGGDLTELTFAVAAITAVVVHLPPSMPLPARPPLPSSPPSPPPLSPAPPCGCSPYYDLERGLASSPTFLNSTNALFYTLQTSSAWPLSLPVYDPAWGCACESAEDRPVWLAALDLCFWFDNQTATQREALVGGSGQLQQAYERACTAFAPGEQVNEYYHHVRLCATPAFVRDNYYLSKEYCIPEAANNFTLYPRLARDGAMMCGTDIGPVGTTQSNEEADCPCNIFFDYDALANSSATALDSVSTFYAVISQTNSSWPVRRPRSRDGECACDDPEFRPVWLAPIDMCDFYDRQPAEVQALLLPPDPGAQAVYERACLGLSRLEQNRDIMHVKFCADRAFITDIFYEHDYCQRPDELGRLIPSTAPDGLLFCQGIIPSPSPPLPPLLPLPLQQGLTDNGVQPPSLLWLIGLCLGLCCVCGCCGGIIRAARSGMRLAREAKAGDLQIHVQLGGLRSVKLGADIFIRGEERLTVTCVTEVSSRLSRAKRLLCGTRDSSTDLILSVAPTLQGSYPRGSTVCRPDSSRERLGLRPWKRRLSFADGTFEDGFGIREAETPGGTILLASNSHSCDSVGTQTEPVYCQPENMRC